MNRVPFVRVVALLAIVLLASSLLLPMIAQAEHSADHRFRVKGKVTRANGQGIADVKVRAYVQGSSIDGQDRTACTGVDGSYLIQLHMHYDVAETEEKVSEDDSGKTVLVELVGSSISRDFITGPNYPVDLEAWGVKVIDFDSVDPGGLTYCSSIFSPSFWNTYGIPLVVVVVIIVAVAVLFLRFGGKKSVGGTLSELPGIGRAKMDELERLGIRDLRTLAKADPQYISDNTSIGHKHAKKLVQKAKERLAEQHAPKADTA